MICINARSVSLVLVLLHTSYFEGRRRLFSIQIEGRFRQRLRMDRILFGSSFKHKISMPRGASVAMSILRG